MKLHWNLLIPAAVLALSLFSACGDDDDTSDATNDPTTDPVVDPTPDPSTDPTADPVVDPVVDPEPDATTARWEQPEGSATLWIAVVDETETYTDGQLGWKGSFSYDETTNVLTYDAGWAGGTGPYPRLFDDGPWTEGGHEAVGQTAGDHTLTAEVFFTADAAAETVIGYGMENENAGWIWVGDNGSLTVPAGFTGTLEATGMTLPGFGGVDMIITLDTSALATGFENPAAGTTFEVKGTFSGWGLVSMWDDATHGDEVAADGVFTMQWSQGLDSTLHQGLLTTGQTYEFVFTLNGAMEYKVGGNAAHEGVIVQTDADGAFADEFICDITGGMGGMNTAIIVGGTGDDCTAE